ncbi:MAG: CBS domain-containing protein [Candidatus Dadabacteria bacterium]|nr:CBS domain-containing protein [Candidatus Dadabacteria bacterium]NIS07910.1 CBS domain-containing protein [Candidatus Dadabacteria bacterium]NIV41206.1 CBS domain-containing protein [Candidatus Dadabacteria bacterium]NIY21496.1 CBS domain-containing protein [Candidatus Dadabacteria bacterium]
MGKNESVTKILTTDVLTVNTKQKISAVNKIFRENMVHHVPVLEGKKPLGIISTNDIFRIMFDVGIADDRMTDAILDYHYSIRDIMTTELVTLPITSTIKDVAKVLQFSTIHSILITNDKGELEGIVTSTDLIKYLYQNL